MGARPLMWSMHAHKRPKENGQPTTNALCVWKMAREDDECGAGGQRTAPFIQTGFNTRLLSLTASGFHPISVPAQFSDLVPSKQNDGLISVWRRIHSVVVTTYEKRCGNRQAERGIFSIAYLPDMLFSFWRTLKVHVSINNTLKRRPLSSAPVSCL